MRDTEPARPATIGQLLGVILVVATACALGLTVLMALTGTFGA